MSTARDIVTSSLRLIGVLASGESAQASEATDGLSALNQLIDSWSNENLLIPNKVREVFPLVSSQQTYTMGASGNFNTSRPLKIENALMQLTSSSPVIEIPMRILNQDEYAGIILKTSTSTFPLYMYSDNAYPLTTISVWPVPTATNSIVLYSWKPLATLATLTTAISLPPGYERALRYALAQDLAPEYGRPIREDIVQTAMDSKAAIKRMNVKPYYLQADEALSARPSVWNWITGEPQ